MFINKKIILIGSIIFLGLVSILVLVVVAFTPEPQNTSSKITVAGTQNESIEINDIFVNPIEQSLGAMTYYRDPDVASYFYNELGDKFTITLNEGTYEEFMAKKPIAESQFLNRLGISEQDACKLNVEVLNGGSLDPALQNRLFELSFCN